MGTNFYLRRVKPREVHDEYHIAKRSAGWKIHFQDSTPYEHDDTDAPDYHSVQDICELLKSGEYQLSNEYGDVYAPGEESLREFEELCQWDGGMGSDQRSVPYRYFDRYSYIDPDGYYFDRREFF